jgi:cytochrome c-type biogenesis protein CcmH/NrfG
MPQDPVDRDLDEMTQDPALTTELKASLRRLSDGAAGPMLAEMARDVLEGRTTLRDVARSSAYATAMTDVVGRLQDWNANLSDREREELATEARTDLRKRPDNSGS